MNFSFLAECPNCKILANHHCKENPNFDPNYRVTEEIMIYERIEPIATITHQPYNYPYLRQCTICSHEWSSF